MKKLPVKIQVAKTPKKVGKCRLCLNETSLCNSHIIPKFIWKDSGLTGANKKFSVRCVSKPELSEPNRQDGFKEHLLCKECEAKFQKYEDYMKHRLKGAIQRNSEASKVSFVWAGWDYKRTKLFQMSLLWRMGISNHPYYSLVTLGTHEEKLRKLLLAENPAEPWRYGCTSCLMNHNGNPIPSVFSQPYRGKISSLGMHRYRFLIAGMLWVYDVASHRKGGEMDKAHLQLNGDWVMLIDEIMAHPQLEKQVQELLKSTS